MADVNLQSSDVSNRTLTDSDIIFGADPTEDDASAAFKTDTLGEISAHIRNQIEESDIPSGTTVGSRVVYNGSGSNSVTLPTDFADY